MLDKRTIALLKIIDGECTRGGYKIFSTEELLSSMPIDFNVDEDGIRESINILSEKQYINVKYQDEKEVCLVPLPKGRLVFENIIDGEIEKSRAERQYLICSLIGGIIGGAAAFLMGVILCLIWVGLC